MALTRNTSRAMQRQTDLATAVAQEKLLDTHVRHVLALVELVSSQIPFDAALDIYARILRLNPEQARNVGSRAFAELGRRGLVSGPGPGGGDGVTLLEDDAADREEARRGPPAEGGRFEQVFSRVRRRIRGRVQDDLRHRINLAAARAEDDLFEQHVSNALDFARSLAAEVPLHEAVDLYLEILGVPEGVSDVVFNRALRRVADDELPPLHEGAPVAASTAA
ncbi:MAG TPA: hypothetical protein VFS20_04375 [Longimicrobium sp.]|nr:hypothetical protein [Longimicrobium sp.]